MAESPSHSLYTKESDGVEECVGVHSQESVTVEQDNMSIFKNGDKDPTKIQKLARHLRAQQQENRRNSQITHAEREKRKGKIDEGLRRISPSQHRRGCRKYA
jgi:hypothetical protein